MKEQNRSIFEREWQDAFDGAEKKPSAAVWDKIELGMAKAASSNYKKRLLFFKLLAAASVAFALGIGGYGVYQYYTSGLEATPGLTENNGQKDATDTIIKDAEEYPETSKAQSNNKSTDQVGGQSGKAITDAASSQGNGYTQTQSDDEPTNVTETESDYLETNIAEKRNKASEEWPEKDNKNGVDGSDASQQTKVTPLVSQPKSDNVVASNGPASTTDSRLANKTTISPDELEGKGLILSFGQLTEREMEMVPWYSYIPEDKSNNRSSSDSWIALGFAVGDSDLKRSQSSKTDAAIAELNSKSRTESFTNNSFYSNEEGKTSYNVGVEVGKQVGGRWLVESGVTFLQRNTSTQSNLAVQEVTANRLFASSENLDAQDQLVVTDTYEAENSYHSIAVPVQAGYILVDSRFDIILQGGVANEFLLFNKIEDTSGKLTDNKLEPGSESLYRTYSISGLVGSEFGYKLSDHYHLSLSPQLRKSLTSITKSEAESENRPLIFSVGFKFKYLFK